MVTLTQNVTKIVNQIAEQVPDMSGIRYATEPGQALSFSPPDGAAEGNQTIEQDRGDRLA